jgi:hypothetical protein
MNLLDKIKNVKESNIPKTSIVEKSGSIDQAKSALSNALSPVTDMGTDAVIAFLKTKEGKKVIIEIAKPILQKYWWAIVGILSFELIGIFATIKFSLSRR